MKTVYIVESCSGDFSEMVRWISGIFDSFSKAEEYRDELNTKAKLIKEAAPPSPEEWAREYKSTQGITKEYNKINAAYWKYYEGRKVEMNWRGATVGEYKINQKIH